MTTMSTLFEKIIVFGTVLYSPHSNVIYVHIIIHTQHQNSEPCKIRVRVTCQNMKFNATQSTKKCIVPDAAVDALLTN